MKIAYLGQMADVSCENGISKKIRAQTAEWLRLGHEVHYFGLEATAGVWGGLAPLPVQVRVRGGVGQRILQSRRLAQDIRVWRPDVIYFRYAYHSAGLPELFRQVPAVAEINSDDLAEYPLTLSWPKLVYHRLTRARILSSTTALVCVTHELATRLATFAKPTEVIANGIDLENKPHVSPAPAARPRLIFVGSPGSPWHGLERVNELAGLLPDVEFDVVGCDVLRAPPPTNVHFHGVLTRERYEPLLHAATAAIGTMALYRKRMDEACPLKVREYLAAGLPVIAAYHDTDVPADADYFLRLPNGPGSLAPERERITAWLARWRDCRVDGAAVAHLDTRVKERQRLAFLARIAGGATP